MEQVKSRIWVRTKGGEEFVAFSWTRDDESGIRRAFADAKKHGIEIVHAWAVPVEHDE